MAAIQTTAVKVLGGVTSGTSNNFGSVITAGRTLVVGMSIWDAAGTNTVTSVTDTLGNTYSQVATVTETTHKLYIFRAFNVLGGTNAVTVNLSGSSDLTFAATEIDTVPITNPNDASNSATGTSTTPSVSVTTVNSAPQVFGVFAHDGTNRTLTEGSGWTMLAENEGGSANMPLAWMYQAYASSGAKTVNGTIGTGVVNWAILGASFASVVAATLDQYGFRGRNDDGSETTATWKAAQNTSFSITPDQAFRLRFGINASGDPASAGFKVQYRKVGAAAWRDVDTSG